MLMKWFKEHFRDPIPAGKDANKTNLLLSQGLLEERV